MQDDLLEKAKNVLKEGGEVFWFNGPVKHVHSLKKPHLIGCFGQCCDQPERLSEKTPKGDAIV
jgi:hypothetical protein